MKLTSFLTASTALVMVFIAAPSFAQNAASQTPIAQNPITKNTVTAAAPQSAFDAKHEACLERITQDPDLAFEEAMIWRGDGGGRRAKHCEAMALFAVGHAEEAAYRLNQLAQASDGGTDDMRADFYAESANFWLVANLPKEAYAAASAGLELRQSHIDLRIARARAYALLGHYDYAETDLTSALVFNPAHAGALRYRADARRKLGNLDGALADIKASMTADPISVETALVRGEIIEAMRVAKPNAAQ